MVMTAPIESRYPGRPNGSPPQRITWELVEPEEQTQETSGSDRLLLDAFLAIRNRARGPVVAISERTMITNTSASELLQPPDRWPLWECARQATEDGSHRVAALVLSNGIGVSVRCKPVDDHGRPVGAVLQLAVSNARSAPALHDLGVEPAQMANASSLDASLLAGWIELTDTERSVAEIVARGLTNKQAARQMYVSRHTIDSHLRRVFRKLGVTSRVELARIVGEHYEALRESTDNGQIQSA
jgi:DNA-binding CsgD family transcriptional regulator